MKTYVNWSDAIKVHAIYVNWFDPIKVHAISV